MPDSRASTRAAGVASTVPRASSTGAAPAGLGAVALGLVHYTDGVVGTRRRIATAGKYLDDFLIATECGFGRRPPETVPAPAR